VPEAEKFERIDPTIRPGAAVAGMQEEGAIVGGERDGVRRLEAPQVGCVERRVEAKLMLFRAEARESARSRRRQLVDKCGGCVADEVRSRSSGLIPAGPVQRLARDPKISVVDAIVRLSLPDGSPDMFLASPSI
jgi:hypothetical protein